MERGGNPPSNTIIDTSGGPYIAGNANTGGGDIIGRDNLSVSQELALHEARYHKVQALMPDLIAEMRADIKRQPLIREFFLISRKWAMNSRSPAFDYYLEEHDDLQSKVQILENHAFVIDVTTGRTKKYRMMEHFVEHLLS